MMSAREGKSSWTREASTGCRTVSSRRLGGIRKDAA